MDNNDKNNRRIKKSLKKSADILDMFSKRQEQDNSGTPMVRNIRIGHNADGDLEVVKDSIQPMSEAAKKIHYRNEQSKLRDFLNNLDKDTCPQDYTESDLYRLGYSDGYDKGYGDAYFELFKVLKAIETIIEPHVENQ